MAIFLFIFITMMIFSTNYDFGTSILITATMFISIKTESTLISFIIGAVATLLLIYKAFSTTWSIALVIILIIWIAVFVLSLLSKISD